MMLLTLIAATHASSNGDAASLRPPRHVHPANRHAPPEPLRTRVDPWAGIPVSSDIVTSAKSMTHDSAADSKVAVCVVAPLNYNALRPSEQHLFQMEVVRHLLARFDARNPTFPTILAKTSVSDNFPSCPEIAVLSQKPDITRACMLFNAWSSDGEAFPVEAAKAVTAEVARKPFVVLRSPFIETAGARVDVFTYAPTAPPTSARVNEPKAPSDTTELLRRRRAEAEPSANGRRRRSSTSEALSVSPLTADRRQGRAVAGVGTAQAAAVPPRERGVRSTHVLAVGVLMLVVSAVIVLAALNNKTPRQSHPHGIAVLHSVAVNPGEDTLVVLGVPRTVSQ